MVGVLFAVALAVGFTLAFDLTYWQALVVGMACGAFGPLAFPKPSGRR